MIGVEGEQRDSYVEGRGVREEGGQKGKRVGIEREREEVVRFVN